ncbi:pyridoxamine 5'-phosphate oxidase [Heliobacillus mobilis]|uniref:Pyridoxamine 5'-phosphate oxidase n=1 Tax=Heliobacterium mobile TaxID=28064 RepID=A0A6I3SPC3_HELMO|nr:pyridoxamine 5'-phosphate oxidase family protein [Heliobacterium mobile]MTV50894.1 pyridoxamine 5'-phosphate oxidase [Heliobacterium mobile]
MKEAIEFLNAHKTGCFATVENGKPRVRPWAFMLEDGGKFWFCTANNKDVYRQLKENPHMEFTSWEVFTIFRISGEVKFSQDIEMKKKILEENPGLKSLYGANDPVFEIFYLEHGNISFAGKTYEF